MTLRRLMQHATNGVCKKFTYNVYVLCVNVIETQCIIA